MSQQFLLPCACGQKVRVEPAQAGGRVSCRCGQSLTVPTLRGLRELEPAKELAPAKAAPGWSRIHGAIFALSLLVAGSGLAVIGVYAAIYAAAMQRTTDRTDDVIREFDQTQPIESLTPLGALLEWQSQVVPGLHVEVRPDWVDAKAAAARALHWIRLGACLLAGGLIPAIATLYIGRGRMNPSK
jgi:hypothetical protein